MQTSPARVGSVTLRHPVMTASGTAGYGTELARYVDLDTLGAVVVKSLAHFSWEGNAAPRLAPVPGGMLNAVGLQGPGIESWIGDGLVALEALGATVVLSIWGFNVDDYVRAVEIVRPIASRLAAVEVNLSCPNIAHGDAGATNHEMFAHSASLIAEIMEATKGMGCPAWAKMSPNTHELVAMARAARDAGAEAVTLINTVRGMSLSSPPWRASLGNGAGGLSGRSIHPIALRAVHEVHAAMPTLPIVGVGGITCGHEALAMMAAGASAVQVGTASFADPRACAHVRDELDDCAREHGVTSWVDVVGRAHRSGR